VRSDAGPLTDPRTLTEYGVGSHTHALTDPDPALHDSRGVHPRLVHRSRVEPGQDENHRRVGIGDDDTRTIVHVGHP